MKKRVKKKNVKLCRNGTLVYVGYVSIGFALFDANASPRFNGTRMNTLYSTALGYANVFGSALYRDSCLYIVPGSHRVPRTVEQRKHSETMEPPRDPLDMPGVVQLTLQRA